MGKISFLLILFMIFFAECGNLFHGLPELGPDKLKIVNTYPADGDADVSLDAPVVITFNKNLDEASVNSDSFIVTKDTGEESVVEGKIVFQSMNTIIFDPEYSIDMDPLTEYSIKITEDVKDDENINLASEYSFKFTTCPPEKPGVLTTDPGNGATVVPVGSPIKVFFKNRMDTESLVVSDTFKVTENSNTVNGTISFDNSAQVLTFNPEDSYLKAYTQYHVTVTTGVKNKYNINLEKEYPFSFTTGDTVIPKVDYTVPQIGEDGTIPYNISSISFIFNKDFISSSSNIILGDTFIVTKNGIDISSSADIDVIDYDNKITCTPEGGSDMDPGSEYKITITTGIKDIDGLSLEQDYIFSFTTSVIPDTTPPEIISTGPAAFFYYEADFKATAVFSECICNTTTELESIFQMRVVTGNGEVIINGKAVISPDKMSVTFTPYPRQFQEEKTYKAYINYGIKDCSTIPNMMTPTSWTFRHLKTYSLPCLIPEVNMDCNCK